MNQNDIQQAKLTEDDDIQDYVRLWVNLTEDELLDLAASTYTDDLDLMRQVQAKLKDKNT